VLDAASAAEKSIIPIITRMEGVSACETGKTQDEPIVIEKR